MKILLVSVYLLLISSLSLFAQRPFDNQRNEIRQKVQAAKVAYITTELNLLPQEAERFWPLYNQYQERVNDLDKGSDVLAGRDINQLTDREADEAVERYFQKQERELQLKRELYTELRKVISPRKLVKLKGAEERFKLALLERAQERRNARNE